MCSEYVPNTADLRKKLRAHMRRTDIGPMKFLKAARDLPEYFTEATLANWIGARIQKIRKAELDYVLSQYAAFPSANVPITRKIRQSLDAEIERAGMPTPSALALDAQKPEDLPVATIAKVLNGTAKKIHEHHWRFILERLQALPDQKPIELTEKLRNQLKQELSRTRLDLPSFSALLSTQTKRQYTPKYLSAVVSGELASISELAWRDLCETLSGLPDAPPTSGGKGNWARATHSARIPLTQPMRNKLEAEFRRTGASSVTIVRAHSRLTASTLSRWRKSDIASVSQNEWDELIAILESLPDTNSPQTQ